MLTATNVSKFLGGRQVLDGVSFQMEPGEIVALVGVNGSGKSTLLRICARENESDGGEIAMPRGTTLGYLPQHAELDTDATVAEELRSVYGDLDAKFAESDRLAHRMAELDHDSPEYADVAERFGDLHHELDRLGAYEADSRIDRILSGLGFRPADRDKPCRTFSGGWRMRILLARLLLANPDAMLLDEPTNHLDLETMIWLEEWIRGCGASVLMVSHERRFMDSLADRVFELHEGRLAIYKGNYSQYLVSRAERWEQWRREYENQQVQIQHLQKFIDRFRYNASKAQMAQSRIKQLDKIERIPAPPSEPGAIHFRFPAPDRGSKEVFSLKGVSKSFGNHLVLRDVDLAIWRGERVALVGLNGAGKSTLMKLMCGVEAPTSGEIDRGSKSRFEYFAQYDADGLTPGNTVQGEIATVAPTGSMEQARALLGGFFFSGEALDKPVTVLSGGERTRLRLAKMLFSSANALLLDEPTNHLDLASRQTLENAMRDYEGTVVFVSHDRDFIDAVATRVLYVKDGGVRSFPGNYADFCHQLRVLGEDSPLMGASVGSGGPSKATTVPPAPAPASGNGKSDPAPSAAQPAAPKPATPKPAVAAPSIDVLATPKFIDGKRGKKGKGGGRPAPEPAAPPAAAPRGEALRQAGKDNQKEERRLKNLVKRFEEEIARLEARVADVEAEMARPEIYKDFTKTAPLQKEKDRLATELASYMEQWERYASELSRL